MIEQLWTSILCAFARMTRLLPLPVARFIGRWLGRGAFVVLRHRRAVALRNLDEAYGESLTPDEKRRIARGAMENFGVVAFEFSRIRELHTATGRNYVEIQGLNNVDTARGGLLLSGHVGNWEWMAPAAAAAGFPLAEVVNTYRDPRRDGAIDRIRRSGHIETIPKNAAAGRAIALLKEHYFVGILIDQSARHNAVPATMFGRPCWATAGPAVIALRTGAPVYLAKMHRKPDGNYVLDVDGPIEFEPTGNFRADVCALTQKYQDALEAHIRTYPEQWHWMHKRWKPRAELQARWESSHGFAAGQQDAAAGESLPQPAKTANE